MGLSMPTPSIFVLRSRPFPFCICFYRMDLPLVIDFPVPAIPNPRPCNGHNSRTASNPGRISSLVVKEPHFITGMAGIKNIPFGFP
jgi:hypothetical protein